MVSLSKLFFWHIWFASASIYLGVLLVCAGIITLLVIIYQSYSPSLVCARSQEEIEFVFAGTLCYTDLTGARQRSDWCLLWSSVRDRSDRSPPPVWPVDTCSSSFREEKLKLVVTPIHPLGDIKDLSGMRFFMCAKLCARPNPAIRPQS
jgi:hypothetical protein